MGRLLFIFCGLCFLNVGIAQKTKSYQLLSPDKKLQLTIEAGEKITWSVTHDGQMILLPSAISMTLEGGEVLGNKVQVSTARQQTEKKSFKAIAYKKDYVVDHYNQLVLACRGDYGLIFRAYDDGVAYRFYTNRKEGFTVVSEKSEFNFDKDYEAYIPHTSDLRGGERYSCSFEEFYTKAPISGMDKDTLGYLPLLISFDKNKKAVVLEADVQDYPGMFVQKNAQAEFGIQAHFAPYPLEEALGGHNRLNLMVTKRANFIAKVKGKKNFPWRAIVVSTEDRQLLNNDLVQKLSEPSRIQDPSWIKPGKVAWDWWNDWNISHVDFKAGINTATYKYYIDFASANKIEYVVLDEGWSDDWDLHKLNPAIDLLQLLSYAKNKNVGIILWSTWYALSKDIDGLCAKYSGMGVKGFKVDFLDRDDQKMMVSCYEMGEITAKHKLLLDFHGMFKPQGMQRTWPNIVNFEGVRGMEYMKWSADERVPEHEVSIPFIRMMAGPMDYTPGAMRNTTKGNAKASNSSPVSMGTRCHQLAMYVVYEAPLQMLADNPTIYKREQECTDFIAKIPTVFNETIALDGKLGEYVVIARKNNDAWYVGAMTNWDGRDISIDFSFLGADKYRAEIFKDGINADRDATDYKKEIITVDNTQKLTFHLAPGGGMAMHIIKQ
jgi:alpha-glucosidase